MAGAAGAVLGAQGEAHGLNLLSKRVEGAKDLLHAFAAHQEFSTGTVGRRHVRVVLRKQLASIDGTLGLGTPLDGQWLNNLARWALGEQVGELAHFNVEESKVW